MTSLPAGERIAYQVGVPGGWSDRYTFRTLATWYAVKGYDMPYPGDERVLWPSEVVELFAHVGREEVEREEVIEELFGGDGHEAEAEAGDGEVVAGPVREGAGVDKAPCT